MRLDRRRALAAAALLAASVRVPVLAAAPGQERHAARIRGLIARMTLAEKLGQMTQIPGGRQKALNSRLDAAMLDRVRRGEVGSFLHVAGAAALKDLQRVAVEESRLGIPLLFAMDVIHGYRTILPVPLALAASWDPAVAEAAARLAAEEAWAAGLHWTFAPMVDIARDARWGRVVEGAGEDPYLGSRMAEAQVRGFQGPDLGSGRRMLACAKHFAGYGAAAGGRDYDSADLSDRTLNEVYLPPFHAAMQAGAGSFMTAFNDIAGVPMTAHAGLLRGQLRRDWGYRGLVVSDWNAINELIAHGVAETPALAAALALRAGVDMDMASNAYATHLAAAVAAEPDLLPLVDEAAGRVLAAKAALGLFDDPYGFGDPAREGGPTPASRAIARDLARRSIVLLRNDGGLLPIAKGRRIALIGALADDASSTLGSWRARGQAGDAVTLRQALEASGASVEYQRGVGTRPEGLEGIAPAVAAANRADLVLLVIGEDYDLTGEARSQADIGLPDPQTALADAIRETGKPVAVVLMNGRPLALEAALAGFPAVLETWFLGVESGPAIVDVLTGAVSPGGRLPVSMPRHGGQAPLTYAHAATGRPANPDLAVDSARYRDVAIGPLFPFGHGLGYTRFDYAGLAIEQAGGAIRIAASVTNAGAAAGDEVVQLYLRDPVASVARPVKELRGFARVTLKPGETRRVTFTISPDQMAIWHAGKWLVEPGTIEVMLGASSDDIRLRGSFAIAKRGEGRFPAAAIAAKVQIA
ncbi:glycoside hydrolase family 3 N-terminal domain-containing protein [Sphingomonas canadensis]|uniref:Glycoside hydrolase family 3 N-terminal domain-containing protein n=1 Tax=Sphingomonas canadensis TaxID=1219257 RepID=A0ABW3H5K0_9SPHN|nr:glycoside hydrolase family 3 N-terminal domain-containing protein [Sphingomonas canadensis]MCW3836463.1 glycoside hydrolase family 3 C-terminal domain-containing protein [Sphingomonas canadensis]